MHDFVDQIQQHIVASGINPELLTLEITEGIVIENIAYTIEKMRVLKQVGVGFSIDDFGTGYSSLSYLKELPLDQLKIDQSFVKDIQIDQGDEVIVETIIHMAGLLGLDVVAEGVETEQQVQFLVSKGCSCYQGYYFSRPVDTQQFTQYLRQRDGLIENRFAQS